MQWTWFAVALSWTIYGGVFVRHHLQTLRLRRGRPEPASARDHSSLAGMLLEGASVFIVFHFREPGPQRPPWVAVVAALLGLVAILLAAAAIRALGRHWRLQAVVTEDHELVREGPYGLVRHPVYLSFFAMTMATGLALTRWEALAAAALLFFAGTEIRVRAEDALLRARFGAAFEEYSRTVRAWLPFLR